MGLGPEEPVGWPGRRGRVPVVLVENQHQGCGWGNGCRAQGVWQGFEIAIGARRGARAASKMLDWLQRKPKIAETFNAYALYNDQMIKTSKFRVLSLISSIQSNVQNI